MTLSTYVYLSGPVNNRSMFKLALESICWADGDRFQAMEAKSEDCSFGDGMSIMTLPNQGLPAWTFLKYKRDEPYAMEDVWEDDYLVTPACSAVINWDTAYGYRNERESFGCATLHAKAIEYFSRNLPSGITFKWKNEFTGEIFDGLDGLDDFK